MNKLLRFLSCLHLGLVLTISAIAQKDSVISPTYVLDMHCHVAGIGAGNSGAFVAKSLRDSYKMKVYLKSFYVTEEELLKAGDQLVVKKISEK